MKYSLRSLMIAVTLGCVGLGGVTARAEYLRRWAAFHERESAILSIKDDEWGGKLEHKTLLWRVKMSDYHRLRAQQFRNAVRRPWTIIGETRDDKEVGGRKVDRVLIPEPPP